jgi:hypothetical protein
MFSPIHKLTVAIGIRMSPKYRMGSMSNFWPQNLAGPKPGKTVISSHSRNNPCRGWI